MSGPDRFETIARDSPAVLLQVARWLERRGIARTGVLIGVSGGADSVALLRALHACRRELSLDLCAAHLDHGLRTESDADAQWVRELCEVLLVPVLVERVDVQRSAADAGLGIEEAARRARFDFFCRVAAECSCAYVAVAHTADDHVETILHHVIRGTGLAGLRGIPEVRLLETGVTLIRPLRNVSRAQVLDYLDGLLQEYRIDVSNEDERFTRNRLRHRLLPLLRSEFNPQVDEALARLARQVADVHSCVEELAAQLLQSALIERRPDRVCLNCEMFCAAQRHLVREAMCRLWIEQQWPRQRMGFDDWDRLAALAQSRESAKSETLPHQMLAVRRESRLEISRPA